MTRITAKLGTMRKAQDFVVYPASKTNGTDQIVIQSDTRICQFNPFNGVGLLSDSKPNGAYFIHLNVLMGAKWIVVPKDVCLAAKAAQPKSGDAIGPGVMVA
jgi:hypothetical protein